jgi:hypothetical protein
LGQADNVERVFAGHNGKEVYREWRIVIECRHAGEEARRIG